MATKKSGGSSKNNRDSRGQRLGVKRFGNERILSGHIIVRQRGSKFHAGRNVKTGKDYTLFSVVNGHVQFQWNKHRKKTLVHVIES